MPTAVIDTSQVFLAAREVEGRKTLYLKVQNSDELNAAIREVFPGADPNRYMHLSIANVHGGDSFKSVGDINKADEGEQKNIVPAVTQQKKEKPKKEKKKGPNIRAMAMGMHRGGKTFEEIQAQIQKTTGANVSVVNIKKMVGAEE